MSQAELALRAQDVTSYCVNLEKRAEMMQQSCGIVKEIFVGAADTLSALGHEQYAPELRNSLEQLLQAQKETAAAQMALRGLMQSYQPTLEATDFAAAIERGLQEALANPALMTSAAQALFEFDRALGNKAAEGAQGEDMEEELIIEDAQLNNQCPLSGKAVLDLKEPVEDSKGYVYEKAAIVAYIQQQHGSVACPIHGTMHRISLRDLRPCARIKRQQRLRNARGPVAGPSFEGEVLDAD